MYTKENLFAYDSIQIAKTGGAKTLAPKMLEKAEWNYAKAERKIEDGKIEEGNEYFYISSINAKHALSISRAAKNKNEHHTLKERLAALNETKSVHQDELAKSVSKLEFLIDKLSVSTEYFTNFTLNNLDLAADKIEELQGLHADLYAKELFEQASAELTKAQDAYTLKEFKISIEHSKASMDHADAAHKVTTARLDYRDEFTEKLSNLYGVVSHNSETGIELTLEYIFTPGSESIFYDSLPTLDAIGNLLIEHDGLNFTIDVWAKDSKNEAKNKRTTSKQANTLRAFFISKGVEEERIKQAVGRGSEGMERSATSSPRFIEIAILFTDVPIGIANPIENTEELPREEIF